MKNNATIIKMFLIVFLLGLIPLQGFAMEGSSVASNTNQSPHYNEQDAFRAAVIDWLQGFPNVFKDISLHNYYEDLKKENFAYANQFKIESEGIRSRIQAFNKLNYQNVHLEYQEFSSHNDENKYYIVTYCAGGINYYFLHLHDHIRRQWRVVSKKIERALAYDKCLLDLCITSFEEAEAYADLLNRMPHYIKTTSLESNEKREFKLPSRHLIDILLITYWLPVVDFCDVILRAYQLELHNNQNDFSVLLSRLITRRFVTEYVQQIYQGNFDEDISTLMLHTINQMNTLSSIWEDAFVRSFAQGPNIQWNDGCTLANQLWREIDSETLKDGQKKYNDSPFASLIAQSVSQEFSKFFSIDSAKKVSDNLEFQEKKNQYFFDFTQRSVKRAVDLACKNTKEALRNVLERNHEFKVGDLLTIFCATNEEHVKVLLGNDQCGLFEYADQNDQPSYFVYMTKKNMEVLATKVDYFKSMISFSELSQNATDDCFRKVVELQVDSPEDAERQFKIIAKILSINEQGECGEFLYYLSRKNLEKFFKLFLICDYFWFDGGIKNYNMMSRLMAYRLIKEYCVKVKNDNYLPDSSVIDSIQEIVIKSPLERSVLKNDLIRIFAISSCGKIKSLDQMIFEDFDFSQPDLREAMKKGERLFNDSIFAKTFKQLSREKSLKVTQAICDTMKHLMKFTKNESKKSWFWAPLFESVREKLRSKNIPQFGSLFTTKSAVSNKSLDQISSDKSVFKSML